MLRRFLTVLSVLAMLAGFAHASLHLAAAPQDHFAGASHGIDCPLAAIDKWSPAPPAFSGPVRMAEAAVLPGFTARILPRPTAPWRSRAPPPAVV